MYGQQVFQNSVSNIQLTRSLANRLGSICSRFSGKWARVRPVWVIFKISDEPSVPLIWDGENKSFGEQIEPLPLQ